MSPRHSYVAHSLLKKVSPHLPVRLARVSVFVLFIALVTTAAFYKVSSASSSRGISKGSSPSAGSATTPRRLGRKEGGNKNRLFANSLLADANAGSRALMSGPALPSGETIETFAADCATPKSSFALGERVCAKTDGVDLNTTQFVNWILLGSSPTVVYGGEGSTDIRTNPQYFVYTPTVQGSYKVSIAIPGDISQTPATFTVGPPSSTPISTYAGDCTSPKSSFALGETVCVKVDNEPLGSGGNPARRLNWIARSGLIVRSTDITADPQMDLFTLPSSATTQVGDLTVDNRGTWRITSNATEDASIRQAAYISVNDPQTASADLWVEQATNSQSSVVNSGSSDVFEVFVSNRGPDAAQNVVLTDSLPSEATFASIVETSGLGFVCVTSGNGASCSIGSLPPGALAKFTVAYTVNSGTATGTVITNSASITSSTSELDTADNGSSGTSLVPTNTGTETCSISCHENIAVTANTTQGGNPGAIVNFSAGSITGSCGALSASPASGSFFPLGTTVVNVSSETGGGSCSFTVTVVEGNAPTISCPVDKTVTAASGATTATVSVGAPTTNPSSGVTVEGVRSDDPLCDDPGCVPVPVTDPYPIGTTTITWTVTDASGLHSSCTQKITVTENTCGDDTENPTITAPPDVTAYTGPDAKTCTVGLDDELGQATAHDNCTVSVSTSGIPVGNAFPVGTTNVTYTATDGAGLTASAVQHVTVIDNTAPIIYAPADASYTCLSDVPAASPSQARGPVVGTDGDFVRDGSGNLVLSGPAFDNCAAMVTVTETSTGVGNASSPRIITRVFKATDPAGNSSSATQTITVIDSTAPTISCPTNIVVYLPLNTTATSMPVSFNVTGNDNCGTPTIVSTPASGSSFSVGTTTVNSTATDAVGNSSSCSFTVTVLYDFTGFFSPVNNLPTFNVVNAGRAVPVKFSLSGNKGLNIFATGYPVSGPIACNSTDPAVDLTGTVTAGGSSLSYDSSSDQYVYTWKTEASWAGTCRQLVVKLNDGSEHRANFKFK